MGSMKVFLLVPVVVLIGLNVFSESATLLEPCSDENNCTVPNSECRFRYCDRWICLCNNGTFAHWNAQTASLECRSARNYNEACNPSTDTCNRHRGICSNSRCECPYGDSISMDRRQCFRRYQQRLGLTFAALGETCDSEITCLGQELQCDNGTCVCANGQREATAEEVAAYPFAEERCSSNEFMLYSVDGCNVVVQNVSDKCDFDVDCPANSSCVNRSCSCDPGFETSTNGSVCYMASGLIGNVCDMDQHCPGNSSCQWKDCSTKVCICDEGFTPSANYSLCFPRRMLNDTCDQENPCDQYGVECINGRCDCGCMFQRAADGISCVPDGLSHYMRRCQESGQRRRYCAVTMTCENEYCECPRGRVPYTEAFRRLSNMFLYEYCVDASLAWLNESEYNSTCSMTTQAPLNSSSTESNVTWSASTTEMMTGSTSSAMTGTYSTDNNTVISTLQGSTSTGSSQVTSLSTTPESSTGPTNTSESTTLGPSSTESSPMSSESTTPGQTTGNVNSTDPTTLESTSTQSSSVGSDSTTPGSTMNSTDSTTTGSTPTESSSVSSDSTTPGSTTGPTNLTDTTTPGAASTQSSPMSSDSTTPGSSIDATNSTDSTTTEAMSTESSSLSSDSTTSGSTAGPLNSTDSTTPGSTSTSSETSTAPTDVTTSGSDSTTGEQSTTSVLTSSTMGSTTSSTASLGGQCENNSGCSSNMQCVEADCSTPNATHMVCVCKKGYASVDGSPCVEVKNIGEACYQTNTTCIGTGSECTSGICACQSNREITSNTYCLDKRQYVHLVGLNETCTLSFTGLNFPWRICANPDTVECNNGTCMCKTGFRMATTDDRMVQGKEIIYCVNATLPPGTLPTPSCSSPFVQDDRTELDIILEKAMDKVSEEIAKNDKKRSKLIIGACLAGVATFIVSLIVLMAVRKSRKAKRNRKMDDADTSSVRTDNSNMTLFNGHTSWTNSDRTDPLYY